MARKRNAVCGQSDALQPHPWNTDPLPPPRYRLTVVHRRIPNKKLEAVSASRAALQRLEAELAGIEYDFIRCERMNGG